MAWDQNRRQNRTLDSLIVIGINANFLLFSAEWILARFDRFQFVVALKIRPTPDATVNDMRKTFAMRDLKKESRDSQACVVISVLGILPVVGHPAILGL